MVTSCARDGALTDGLAKAGLFVFSTDPSPKMPLAFSMSVRWCYLHPQGEGETRLSMKVKSKVAAEIRTLARRHSKAAVKVLAAIMNDEEGPATARVSAAQALLDRGWGKAAQVLAGEEGGLPVLARIERVIVESKVIGAQANGDKNSSGEKSGAHTSD